MEKKYLASLISIPLFMLSTSVFAERPAAAVEDSDPVNVEAASPENTAPATGDDMRPAAAETPVQAGEQAPPRTETRSSGDVMDMPGSEAVAEPVRQLDFPRRGMTQDKVQNELGRPLEIVPAVGEPPITRWVYNDRVVYFEYSSVVHVVAK